MFYRFKYPTVIPSPEILSQRIHIYHHSYFHGVFMELCLTLIYCGPFNLDNNVKNGTENI